MKYAILHKSTGQLVDYCESIEQASWFINQQLFELVDTTHSSKIEVVYTELGGPSGYGHQESSFITYGGLLPCIRRLCRWMQEEARTWGPDPRDIYDYFKNCRLYVNGEDKFEWWYSQISKLDNKTFYMKAQYLLNAFSLQMVDVPSVVEFREVDALPDGLISAIGHQDTANVLGVPMNRINVHLQAGDTAYVAQLQGGRLPEGCTKLPDGFSFKFIKVLVHTGESLADNFGRY